MPKKAVLTHDAILQAAQDVLHNHGVRGLTLDKVAKQAGVSKGGLIHHFPSKDALLLAMLDFVFDDMTIQMERLLAEEPYEGQKGHYLRAYMRLNLETIEQGIPSFILNLLELASVNPSLFQSKRGFFTDMQRKVEKDGIDPVLATIIAGASDSLWLQVLFGILEPNDPQIRAVHNRLIQMTQ